MSTKRGRPFEPGNKFGKGRPPRSLNKKTWLVQQMLIENGPEIVEKTDSGRQERRSGGA